MATSLLYLEYFGVKDTSAQVVSVADTEDGRLDVVLDQTCFYPRGGGQDWDMGHLKSADAVFQVEEVRLDETGTVHHIGNFATGSFNAGATVTCVVDADRRLINTRLHSAGHVLDMAVNQLGCPWTPGRGAHYPHMSFVEYTGPFDPADAERLRQEIQTTVDQAIATGGQNELRFMPVSQMHTVCRHVPTNIPTNKPARVVVYCGNFGVPCGGTHVQNLSDIGKVTITKINVKKGIIKVSYTVEGIN